MQRTVPRLFESPRTRLGVRTLGAILLPFVGADHHYEYSADQWSVLPTVGPLFLLNFISATVLGLLLLAPLERISRRFGRVVIEAAAIGGLRWSLAQGKLIASPAR
jgi:hypothetical protein